MSCWIWLLIGFGAGLFCLAIVGGLAVLSVQRWRGGYSPEPTNVKPTPPQGGTGVSASYAHRLMLGRAVEDAMVERGWDTDQMLAALLDSDEGRDSDDEEVDTGDAYVPPMLRRDER